MIMCGLLDEYYFTYSILYSVLYFVGIQYGRTLLQPLCPWVRTLTRVHFNQNAEHICAQHQACGTRRSK